MQYDTMQQVNRRNFRVCLQVLSHPGTGEQLADMIEAPLVTMAYCLLYSEVSSFFSAEIDQDRIRAISGSSAASPQEADYLFVSGTDGDILKHAKTGSQLHPDHSATLFFHIAPEADFHTRVILQGPGIDGALSTTLPLEPDFIKILGRKNKAYPLGVDCFFLTENGIITAIPRTTSIEIIP